MIKIYNQNIVTNKKGIEQKKEMKGFRKFILK
jgi:hypothetical protein